MLPFGPEIHLGHFCHKDTDSPMATTLLTNPTTDADFVLDTHVLHIHSLRCTNCNHTMKWSDLHEVHIHRTRMGLSGLHRVLPSRSLLAGTPIRVVELAPKTTPACHSCVERLNMARGLSCSERALAESSWAETLRRKYATAAPTTPMSAKAPTATRATSTKHIPTHSDL